MFSNPPIDRLRDRLRGTPIRTRLIAATLALMAAVLAVIGVTTVVLMRNSLVSQLDSRLVMADTRNHDDQHALGIPGGAPGEGGPPMAPGQLFAILTDQSQQSTLVLPNGYYGQTLSPSQFQALGAVPVDHQPHSVDIPDLGDYRVVATHGLLHDGTAAVVVTGLPLADVEASVTTLVIVELGVAAAGLLIAGLAGAWIIRLSLRPLWRVAATARRVSELPLDQGEVDLAVRVPDVDTDPRTEVGQVGRSLNRMLGHVGEALQARHESETRVRQFVADASHELRTPLAAIRGYAELTRRSRDTMAPDVAHALERVESASIRMSTLVDDLLLLARLDSGRPLRQDQVDLSRLAVDALSDAHAAGPDHHWRLDLPEEAVTVTGDAGRLHQVLANLLANARTHTPAGTTVAVGLSTSDNWAELTVTDDGPGIPPALQPEVFERFTRADTSRSRAAGSTGLGLAIVAAVVAAHRGQVAVSSQPGHTEFVVRLPR
jgi:two-component system OmpR family sensor kinase